MKSITGYIIESLTEKQNMIIGDFFVKLIKSSKVQPTDLKNMISNLTLDYIHELQIYFKNTDNENFINYSSTDDEFLDMNNKEKIINKMIHYIQNIAQN